MILFCLPYAGAGEAAYSNWRILKKSSINLFPVSLKGRGKRYDEPHYRDINEATEDIYAQIRIVITEQEYAIFGHSMGSLLAYELYYKIEKEKNRLPKHIFFSGYGPPNLCKRIDFSHTLPEEEFINSVASLGGIPDELLHHKKLLKFFIPTLKNDIKMIEEYECVKKRDPMRCDITILNGENDNLQGKEVEQWQIHTQKKCYFHFLQGDHFYINHNRDKIIDIICNTLQL